MTTRLPIATSNLVQVDGAGAWSTSSAALARSIVQKAVNQRLHLLREGSSGLTTADVRMAIARLQCWLATTNDHLSRGALVRFAFTHLNDLRLVMPSTAGGASLLHQFNNLINMKPNDITDHLNRASGDFTMWDRPALGLYVLVVGPYTIHVKTIGPHFHWKVSTESGIVRSGIEHSSALTAKQLAVSAALAHHAELATA